MALSPCALSVAVALALLGSSSIQAMPPDRGPATEARVAALDRDIQRELDRIARELDPLSARIVRDNQAMWEDWQRATMDKARTMLVGGRAGKDELATLPVELRDMRLTFLRTIKASVPDGVGGGWADGITEVLLRSDGSGHAKMVSITHAMDAGNVICVIEGKATKEDGGLTITADGHPDRPFRVIREGVALSVEDMRGAPGAAIPFCNAGGKLAGRYFHIEGAEKIMPWLM